MPPYTGIGSGGSTIIPPLSYRHRQDASSAAWVISHNLGFRPAGVQVTDSDGNPVAGVVAYPDLNTVLITFSMPVAGVADLS
jgi:hypothetical protein